MHRFTNILFSPLGRRHDPDAAERVFDLALRNGAELTLFGAVPEPSRVRRLLHPREAKPELDEARRRDLAERLEQWHAVEDEHSPTVVASGDPARAIAAQAAAAGHDLVIVVANGNGNGNNNGNGNGNGNSNGNGNGNGNDRTTIRRLMRTCPCPVWVIRPTRSQALRVLVAVSDEPDARDLNIAALEMAASMSELYGGELHVAHAWDAYGEDTMRQSVFLEAPDAEVDAEVESEENVHRRALDDLVQSGPSSPEPHRVHLVKGAPAEVLPRLVREQRIDLLVMGTAGRSGLSGLVMGNTAESVLHEVGCSVMAVKAPKSVEPRPETRTWTDDD